VSGLWNGTRESSPPPTMVLYPFFLVPVSFPGWPLPNAEWGFGRPTDGQFFFPNVLRFRFCPHFNRPEFAPCWLVFFQLFPRLFRPCSRLSFPLLFEPNFPISNPPLPPFLHFPCTFGQCRASFLSASLVTCYPPLPAHPPLFLCAGAVVESGFTPRFPLLGCSFSRSFTRNNKPRLMEMSNRSYVF